VRLSLSFAGELPGVQQKNWQIWLFQKRGYICKHIKPKQFFIRKFYDCGVL
jgi:hypothetical protein